MYQIKQIPEDFIVKEISDAETCRKFRNKGKFTYWKLVKKDYTTMKAVQMIAEKLNINPKRIGFAGNKDRRAVTEQTLSVFCDKSKVEKIKIKDIVLKFLGYGDEPISLGNLEKNEFIITVRNLDKKPKVNNVKYFPNFFDKQRFSNTNLKVGKLIIRNDFKKAIETLLRDKHNKNLNTKISEFLNIHSRNYIGALRLIPEKILRLYVHSYQSYLWNTATKIFLKKKRLNIVIDLEFPVLGFGTEFNNREIEKIYDKILHEEEIHKRDFIIKQIPELSSIGTSRRLFAKIYDLEVLEISKDELSHEKYKIKISFKLDKGCYATTALKYLFPSEERSQSQKLFSPLIDCH